MPAGKRVHVVVALILKGDQVLIALRPDHLHQGGLWEFPGGKVDTGEDPAKALAREVEEELAISIVTSKPVFQITHDYSDRSVMLDIWDVTEFSGEPVGNEGQQIAWVSREALNQYAFPEANRPIIEYLQVAV